MEPRTLNMLLSTAAAAAASMLLLLSLQPEGAEADLVNITEQAYHIVARHNQYRGAWNLRASDMMEM
ncbi:hypothetical protein PoB_001276200, partial [Plakobranchus ocellatus]